MRRGGWGDQDVGWACLALGLVAFTPELERPLELPLKPSFPEATRKKACSRG